MIDVAVPVMAGTRHVGWARVELTRDSVNANLRRLAGVWLGFVLIAILLVALVAVMLARGFMRGVTHLASVADEVQHGNNEIRANVLRKDEVGVLGQHLNRLLDALEEQSALLRESEEQAKSALDELRYQKFALDQHSIVAVTDVSGRIIYANNKFCEISGYSQQELLGQNHRLLNSGTHPAEFFRDMYRTIGSGKVWHGEICNRAKDGRLYWVMTTIVPYLDSHGNPAKYIAIRTDITERKKAEEDIHNLAFYDALTQLPNRRMLNDRLAQAMASSKRSGRYGALMFLDLDNFKPLNDTHGHGVGDLLLIEVARRITNCVREVDTVARFGGDEFVVMLSELDVDRAQSVAQAGIVAEKIRVTPAEPYLLKLRQNGDTKIVGHHCTSSIGVVLFINNPSSKEDILKWADLAMYQAKSDGRNRIRFYEAQH
jgi:diguanylate cyclase (GGDEF)-like protein/PAS domain S-box-containing protein